MSQFICPACKARFVVDDDTGPVTCVRCGSRFDDEYFGNIVSAETMLVDVPPEGVDPAPGPPADPAGPRPRSGGPPPARLVPRGPARPEQPAAPQAPTLRTAPAILDGPETILEGSGPPDCDVIVEIRHEGASPPVEARARTGPGGAFAIPVTLCPGRSVLVARVLRDGVESPPSGNAELGVRPTRPALENTVRETGAEVLTLSGFADPDVLVTCRAGSETFRTTAAPDGLFSFKVRLAEGLNPLAFWSEIGDLSSDRCSHEVIRFLAGPRLGGIPLNWKEPRLRVFGRAPTGSTIQVSVNDRMFPSQVDPGGRFEVDVELKPGPNRITALAFKGPLRSLPTDPVDVAYRPAEGRLGRGAWPGALALVAVLLTGVLAWLLS